MPVASQCLTGGLCWTYHDLGGDGLCLGDLGGDGLLPGGEPRRLHLRVIPPPWPGSWPPAQKLAGPRPCDIFDFEGLGGPGCPGQPGPDRATSSISGVWAAPGAPGASRAPTERHPRFWVSGRPRAAQKPSGPRPSDIFDFGGLGGRGGPRQPGPDRAASRF